MRFYLFRGVVLMIFPRKYLFWFTIFVAITHTVSFASEHEKLKRQYDSLLADYREIREKYVKVADSYNTLREEHKKEMLACQILARECERLVEVFEEKIAEDVRHYSPYDIPLDKKEFERVVGKFIKVVAKTLPLAGIFLQKRIVDPNAQIAIHADIHGDKKSLFAFLKDLADKGYLSKDDPFKINKENFYIAFLGDYTDRGAYGAEVLYTVMRLKLANPDKVFMLRGNHEDCRMNKPHGFGQELQDKFKYREKEWISKMDAVYNLLPVAIYVNIKGTPNYVLLCHGGLAPRCNPHPLLSAKGKNLVFKPSVWDVSWLSGSLQKIIDEKVKLSRSVSGKDPQEVGFLWNDFIVDEKAESKPSSRGLGVAEFGKSFTDKFLKQCSKENQYEIKAIFRGHQHSMVPNQLLPHKGIYSSWSNYQWDGKMKDLSVWLGSPVWTLNVSPGASYGESYDYDYDTYVILKLPAEYGEWTIEPHNVKVPE